MFLCVQGLHLGTRERILTRPQAMLEAKDLPTNKLSALLEQRVLDALATDRQQRAAQQVGSSSWHSLNLVSGWRSAGGT